MLCLYSRVGTYIQFDYLEISVGCKQTIEIKNNLWNHDATDASLKYFKLATVFLNFSEFVMPNARSLRSGDDYNLPDEQWSLVVDLTIATEDAMKETSPVLSAFDLFNPEWLDKSEQNRKELSQILINHYGYVKSDSFEGQTIHFMLPVNSMILWRHSMMR